MGLSDEEAFASVRFSLGRGTTEADIDAVIAKAGDAYALARERAGLSG